MDRLRSIALAVAPATPDDIDAIRRLWRDFGEGNVDDRGPDELEEAIASGGLHTFKSGRNLVATGGFYPYANGTYTELGSSCWTEKLRRAGGAGASVAFRCVLASLHQPGTLLTSELYETSVKSARVLCRVGFEELFLVPTAMHEHAFAANPITPVRHFMLPPWRLPQSAHKLLDMMAGRSTQPVGGVTLNFDPKYQLENPAMRRAIEALAQGDLAIVGHGGEAPLTFEQWVAYRCGSAALSRDRFWATNVLRH